MWFKKMKTPAKDLKQSDFLISTLPNETLRAFDECDKKNDELADADLWTTDSICFRYFNLLQEFKTTKQVSETPTTVLALDRVA
jgi:hypothetical protein